MVPVHCSSFQCPLSICEILRSSILSMNVFHHLDSLLAFHESVIIVNDPD